MRTLTGCACLLLAQPLLAQQPLTLADAHKIALENHPQIAASRFNASAAHEVAREVRSAYQPTVFGSVTGVGADSGTRIAAGALNNPVIYNRLGSGITVSQLVSDFGRTGNLSASAKLRADAADQNTEVARTTVLVRVDHAYFSVLRAQALEKVAEQTVSARQLIVDQVDALVNSKLKSNLDLSFAKVNVSDAKLLLISAQNEVEASRAELATALGNPPNKDFTLSEEPLPESLQADLNGLIQEGIRQRPELASLRLEEDAALRAARAEADLRLPTITTLATVGIAPAADSQIPNHYGAVGVNLNIPIFNGGLFAARRSEAELRARATAQNIKDLENRVERDIRVAYLGAKTALERMGVTNQLLEQAQLALSLAQSRYDLGLSSIVELSQTQLNLTSAQIANTAAKYDYQMQRSQLAFQLGTLRP